MLIRFSRAKGFLSELPRVDWLAVQENGSVQQIHFNPNSLRGLGRKNYQKCLCSHYNNTALIKRFFKDITDRHEYRDRDKDCP